MNISLKDAVATIYAVDTEAGIMNSGKSMLRISSKHSVPTTWIDLLDGISKGNWPKGFVPGTPNLSLLDFYPEAMQEHILSQRETLRTRAHEALGLIRWRWNSDVEPGSLSWAGGQLMWSKGDGVWDRVRTGSRWSASLGRELSLNPAAAAGVNALAAIGAREPVGREIWHVAVKADQLTAIVLSVAAVEVEAKRLVGYFAPQAEWLISNLPAPPIEKIIWNYLPTLDGFEPKYSPPKRLRNLLVEGVKLRNDSVHKGPPSASTWLSPSVGSGTVDGILGATSDLLWLFDVQRSHTWALEYLTHDTRLALGLPAGHPDDPESRVFRVPRDTGT